MMEKRRQRTAPVEDLENVSGIANSAVASSRASVEQLHIYVKNVMGQDTSTYYQSAQCIRKLLSIANNPPIQRVIDTGVIPRLVQFLANFNDSKLQFEAAWALTNIVSGTEEQTRIVINHNAVPAFTQLLRSSDRNVAEQAVWALSNIAGDSAECRDLVLNSGAMPLLIQLLQNSHDKPSLLRNATWALSNLCRGKPQPDFNHVLQALPLLSTLINCNDDEVNTDACWALSYISDDTNETNDKIQAVCSTGCIPRLVQLLTSQKVKVITPALRTLGNIVTGNDSQTQAVLQAGALIPFVNLLASSAKNVRKETCWALSNITAGTKEQIQVALQNNIVPPLLRILQSDVFNVQKEAAWAISNITSGGNPEQINYVVQQGGCQALCNLLTCDDSKIVLVVMEALQNCLEVGKQMSGDGENSVCDIIEECGGLDEIEELQKHENTEVYTKSVTIIQEYFGDEDEDEDTGLAPGSNGNQFSFGAIAPSNGMTGGAPQQPFSFGGTGNFVF